MRINSTTGSSATVNVPAQQGQEARADRHGSGGPRRASGGPRAASGGPKATGQGDRGLHLGQIKKMMREAEGTGSGVDLQALQSLTSRLNDVMERLDTLTGVVGQAVTGTPSNTTGGAPTPAPAPPPAPTSGTTSGSAGTTTGGAGGSGNTGGTGGAGSTSSTASSTFNLIMPFQGPTDFGSITINGVTTTFGIIDAKGGLTANQVASSLVNILNSNPDNTVTAQQRDNKIMLVSKTAGATITIDDISMGSTSGTMAGFAGFLDGMTGSGTLISNPISPVRR